jgi:hypothetical protein
LPRNGVRIHQCSGDDTSSTSSSLSVCIHATVLQRVLPVTKESLTDYPHLEGRKPPNELTSYRPKSLLPTVSKVFEKLLKRLLPMIENNGLIPSHQFGFRQRHSTIEQTHQIVQRIIKALENKQYCSAAFLDISQAFDKVWHTGRMYKLRWSLPLNYFLILKSCLRS